MKIIRTFIEINDKPMTIPDISKRCNDGLCEIYENDSCFTGDSLISNQRQFACSPQSTPFFLMQGTPAAAGDGKNEKVYKDGKKNAIRLRPHGGDSNYWHSNLITDVEE